MKKILLLSYLILTLISVGFAQSEHNPDLVAKYIREAKYYQQKAENYRRDAKYYLGKAKEYKKEYVYYTRKGDEDRAKLRTRYYETAINKYKLRICYAEEFEDKAASCHRKVAIVLRK